MVEDQLFLRPGWAVAIYGRAFSWPTWKERYGGIDSVLLWPVYPNIGIDSRSQHDLLHDLPGGLDGLRQMVAISTDTMCASFFPGHALGHRHASAGRPFLDAAVRDMKAIGADGINGDTYNGIPREFLTASETQEHPLVLEPENHLQQDESALGFNTMSWGYWKYPTVRSQQVQVARTATHGQRLRALGSRSHRRPPVRLLQWPRL